ncbi:hypothetical protein [Scytonema millei]|uniref:hypothetical protein n=1 Tax=Scytonema millei TaxID=1245922 RepID=UPI00403F5026
MKIYPIGFQQSDITLSLGSNAEIAEKYYPGKFSTKRHHPVAREMTATQSAGSRKKHVFNKATFPCRWGYLAGYCKGI